MTSGNADGATGRRFGRTGQGDIDRHRTEETITTRPTRLTQKVRELRRERLTSLMGMLFDPDGLRSSFERQEERKAPGVDGVRKADYRDGLEERIQELSRRVRSLSYRPKPVRRVYLVMAPKLTADKEKNYPSSYMEMLYVPAIPHAPI
jgi:hypothetical protein